MNIFGLHILTKSQVAALKAFGLSELDKAIVAAKQTELGATVASAIHAAEQTGKTGSEKLSDVLAVVTPAVLDYAAKGGFPALVSDAETFGRQLVESTLSDIKVTGLGKLAAALLTFFRFS